MSPRSSWLGPRAWSTITINVEGPPSAFVAQIARDVLAQAVEREENLIVTYPGPDGRLVMEQVSP